MQTTAEIQGAPGTAPGSPCRCGFGGPSSCLARKSGSNTSPAGFSARAHRANLALSWLFLVQTKAREPPFNIWLWVKTNGTMLG